MSVPDEQLASQQRTHTELGTFCEQVRLSRTKGEQPPYIQWIGLKSALDFLSSEFVHTVDVAGVNGSLYLVVTKPASSNSKPGASIGVFPACGSDNLTPGRPN